MMSLCGSDKASSNDINKFSISLTEAESCIRKLQSDSKIRSKIDGVY